MDELLVLDSEIEDGSVGDGRDSQAQDDGLDEFDVGRRLATADLVPPQLRHTARVVQEGGDVPLGDLQVLMRNGMLRRSNGLWILTQSGVRAAAMDRGWILPGGVLTPLGKDVLGKEALGKSALEIDSSGHADESDLDASKDGGELMVVQHVDMAAEKGVQLAAFLNRRISNRVKREKRLSRGQLIQRIASAARIKPGTVNQILRGSIVRPPDARLRGFAKVLNVGFRTLQNLAEQDAGNRNKGYYSWPYYFMQYVNGVIDQRAVVGDAFDRADLVAQMARASGLSQQKVQQGLDGIPLTLSDAQIADMAETMNLRVSAVRDAMHQDGIGLYGLGEEVDYSPTVANFNNGAGDNWGEDGQREETGYMTPWDRLNPGAGSGASKNVAGPDSFSVAKDAKGDWRWTLVSSTGYRDRDNEYVSRKALSNDCARADGDGDYGPLVWWHMYEPLAMLDDGREAYKAVVLGHCDFNAMSGPDDAFLVESGSFVNDEIAQTMAQHSDGLKASIRFTYRPDDLDEEKAYWQIRRRERSLLPKGAESNVFTNLVVRGAVTGQDDGTNSHTMTSHEHGAKEMNQTKYDEFVKLWTNPDEGHGVLMNLGKSMTDDAAAARVQGIGLKEVAGSRDGGDGGERGDGGEQGSSSSQDNSDPSSSSQSVPSQSSGSGGMSGGIQHLKEFLSVFGVGAKDQGAGQAQPGVHDMPGAGMEMGGQWDPQSNPGQGSEGGNQRGDGGWAIAGDSGTARQMAGQEAGQAVGASGGEDDADAGAGDGAGTGSDSGLGDEMGVEALIEAVASRVTNQVGQVIGQQGAQQASDLAAMHNSSEEKSQALLTQIEQLNGALKSLQAENAQLRNDLDGVLGTMPEAGGISHYRATGDYVGSVPGMDAAKAYEMSMAQYDPLVVSTFMQ